MSPSGSDEPVAVEAHIKRGRALGGRGRGHRCRGPVREQVADAADRAAVQVGVVEVAAGTHLEVHRTRGPGHEGLPLGGVGEPVRAGEHHPDAVARVVREEERVAVPGREGGLVVERESRDRRAACRAALPGHHLRPVVVRVVRRGDRRRSLRVERLAEVEVEGVVPTLAPVSLVARPAEVLDAGRGRLEPVDLLPGVPAHVAGPDLVRARPHGDPEGVAQAVCHDPARVQVGAGRVRVVGHGRAGVGVHAEDRAVEARGIARASHVLAAQGSTLGRGRSHRAATPAGWIPARVDRVAVLAVVREVEARAVTPAHVQRAIGAEGEAAERVAWILLAPVLDQHLLGARGVQPREPAADHAAVVRGPRRCGAGVAPARRGGRARVLVVRVQRVDERAPGGEPRVEGHPLQPSIPEVVHPGGEVREHGRGRVREVIEDQDASALLRDEHPAVGREPYGHRVRQPAPDRGLLEVRGRSRGRCRERRGTRERVGDVRRQERRRGYSDGRVGARRQCRAHHGSDQEPRKSWANSGDYPVTLSAIRHHRQQLRPKLAQGLLP